MIRIQDYTSIAVNVYKKKSITIFPTVANQIKFLKFQKTKVIIAVAMFLRNCYSGSDTEYVF